MGQVIFLFLAGFYMVFWYHSWKMIPFFCIKSWKTIFFNEKAGKPSLKKTGNPVKVAKPYNRMKFKQNPLKRQELNEG